MADNCAEGPNQELWILFHQCWGQAQASPEYDKAKWLRLEIAIKNALHGRPSMNQVWNAYQKEAREYREKEAAKLGRYYVGGG